MLCGTLAACATPPGSGVASGPSGTPTAGLAPASIPAPARASVLSLIPSAPSARVYASKPEPGFRGPPADALRDGILEDARAASRRAGRPLPVADARLDWAMTDLAHNVRGDDLPAPDAVDFLLSHYGIVDPPPQLLLSGGTVGADDQIREHARAEIDELLRRGPLGRIGVGIDRGGGEIHVGVGFQETHLDLLAPVPRRLPHGGRTSISARIDSGYVGAQLVITAPAGDVHEEVASAQAGRLGSELRCGADGRYQVEITATGAAGPAVLANFPVFCGVVPPTRGASGAGMEPVAADPDRAEAEMITLVNRDRAQARLPALAADPRLAAIARAHSRDMAEHDFVGHVSPRSGSTVDRVHAAGLSPELILENVGRAFGPRDAETGLLASPGHRGNLLDPRARRIGIGIVFGPPVTGIRPMFVTQVFTN
ncbi:MAG TPA: CAP domain-containing protein [Polyangia bacterium]